jgi:hypothetical protein
VARETEVLGGNLPQCRCVRHRSHMTWPGLEPRPPQLETGLCSIEQRVSRSFSPLNILLRTGAVYVNCNDADSDWYGFIRP